MVTNMSEFRLKAGDPVYYPRVSNEILSTIGYEDNKGIDHAYPIRLEREKCLIESFTTDGKVYSFDANPVVFPATQEWYEKLVHLYPDLERPPVKKSSAEILQAMLDDGYFRIPCYVSDIDSEPRNDLSVVLLIGINTEGLFPYQCVGSQHGSMWRFAHPFDVKTGKVIVDYVDGQVILEER